MTVRGSPAARPVGLCAQLAMMLTVVAAPHVVRAWEGHHEPMTPTQVAFCVCTGGGLVAGANILFTFCTSSVFDPPRDSSRFGPPETVLGGANSVQLPNSLITR